MTRRILLATAALSLVLLALTACLIVSVDIVDTRLGRIDSHGQLILSRSYFHVVRFESSGRQVPLWWWEGKPAPPHELPLNITGADRRDDIHPPHPETRP